jgi:hypothetical protein
VFSAVQTGTRVTFTYTYPGGQSGTIGGNVSPDGLTFTAGAAPDGWTETNPAYCFGTGHGMVQFQMAPDARSFTTVAGPASLTDFGNVISISGTSYTAPRFTPPALTCPGGVWSGRWGDPANPITLAQSGQTVTGTYSRDAAGRPGGTLTGTVDPTGQTLTGTYQQPSLAGTLKYTLDASGRSLTGANTGSDGTVTSVSASFIACVPAPAPAPAPAPNLQTVIPAPQTLVNGPTSIVAPGRVSLRSLRRSKCVLVRVASRQPARVLVSIFSGRLSIRLFGQQVVVFFAAGHRQTCIAVPFRAHTFNVRTPLRVALGYTAGAARQRTGRKPPPVIRQIRLVP